MKYRFPAFAAFILILILCALPALRPARTAADRVCFAALRELGDVYELAACEPGRAFDCSALTSYCYSLVGVDTPRSAQGAGYTKTAPRIEDAALLKRGCMVCFDTVDDSDRSDHVGIYLGRGLFVHASSAAGRVTVSRMADYTDAFSWGVDLLEGVDK